MPDILKPITLKIELPANRDHLGVLRVLDNSGVVLAGPYRIAGRASDEIAAQHGNPTRATTLPYGDPPLGSYRLERLAGTGEGTRYRQDLFGTLDVIVLAGTGGHAALADANGRFEIAIHGGPLATNGGLRASTGHFRISDPDLATVSDLIRRAEAVSCVCQEAPTTLGADVVSDLDVAADRGHEQRPAPRRKPRAPVSPEYLVAFGEYTDTSTNTSTNTSLSSESLPQPSQQGAACMGTETICQNVQYSAAQSQESNINPYTGGPTSTSPLLTDPYSGGPSPFFPNGQPVNSFNGAPPANSQLASGGPWRNAPGAQSGQPRQGPGYNPVGTLPALLNAARGIYVPNAPGVGPYGSSPSAYLPAGQNANPFFGGGQSPRASAGAWNWSRTSQAAQAAIQEQVNMGFRDSPGANVATATAQSGRAATLPQGWPSGTWDPAVPEGYWPSRSIVTSIRAQTAELSGFQARLAMGQIPILAPSGSNIPGPDYVFAVRLPGGDYGIIVSDMKSRVTLNAFGQVVNTLKPTWQTALGNAVAPGTLDLGNPAVEQAIRDAVAQGRVTIVRDTVDFSLQGQGAMELGNVPLDTLITDPALTPPVVEGPPAGAGLASGAAELMGLASIPLAGGLEENPNEATGATVLALAAFAFPELAAAAFVGAVAGALITDVVEDLMTSWRDFNMQQINQSMRSFQGP